jgi:RNA polymerase sigma-70 factor (ECF subfamily)
MDEPGVDDTRDRFEAQVMPHLDAAHRFARWLSGSATDAEDVVQEAFLRAFRAFGTLRGGDVKAWLLTIVRNCHANALRERRRTAALPLAGESEPQAAAATVTTVADPESETIGADQRHLLERLIAQLPAEHREVLLLRELEELSYREIASVAQVPIGTVMSRLARARAALRVQYLQQTPGEPRAVR